MKSFKEYTKSLTEGFLDDDNKEQLTADNFETQEEKETPFPEEDKDDLTEPNELGDDDIDLSDEIGTAEAEADKTEKEDLADLKLDELSDDDTVKDSGDEKKDEKDAELETAERTADTMAELKDAIASLTTKIEALTDKVDNSDATATGDNANATPAEGDLGDLELPAEGDTSTGDTSSTPASAGDESNGVPAEGDANATPAEGDNNATPAEGDNTEENANEGSDEDFGGDESDDTKSEAYNYYCKKGKLLNSNSGSIIGKAMNDKLYDLQEDFEHIIKGKIRKLVEAEKARLKENHFNF